VELADARAEEQSTKREEAARLQREAEAVEKELAYARVEEMAEEDIEGRLGAEAPARAEQEGLLRREEDERHAEETRGPQSGLALESAPLALRADRGVVLAAVRRAGAALQFATEALQDDWEVVFAAVQPARAALYFARQARAIESLASKARALEFASVELRRDPEVMAAVCLECERLEGEWRQAAAELHAAGSERDAELRRAAEAAADQPRAPVLERSRLLCAAEAAMAAWLERSRLLRAAVADKKAAWEEAWLKCPWLPAARPACERFDREEEHAALGRAADAMADQWALRRVSAGSMVFLSVPD